MYTQHHILRSFIFLALILMQISQIQAQDQKPNISNIKKSLINNHFNQKLKIGSPSNITMQKMQGTSSSTKASDTLSKNAHQNLSLQPKLALPIEIDAFMKNPVVDPIQKSLTRWTIEWNTSSATYECEWEILGNAQHILQSLSIQILQTGWWYLTGGKPVSPIKNEKKGTLSWDIQWQDDSKGIEKDKLIVKLVSPQPLSDAQKQTLSQMFTKLPLPEKGKLEQKME